MSAEPLIRCPACGTTNRVPHAKLVAGVAPICGRCRARLPVEARPVTVTDATFSAEVERSPLPVLVDAWAPWCHSCRSMQAYVYTDSRLAPESSSRCASAAPPS